MSLYPKIINLAMASRLRQIDLYREQGQGLAVQQHQLKDVLAQNIGCQYLKGKQIGSYEQFTRELPVVSYEDLAPWVERTRAGEQGVLTNDRVRWMAKSSGTTNDVSKFIPINQSSLERCHMRGGRDSLVFFCHNYPSSRALSGKSLTLGGSHTPKDEGMMVGDLSAILIENTPWWYGYKRLPHKDIALVGDFQQKVELICESCTDKNITNFMGVPSWNLVLMNKVLEYTGKKNLLEVWPDLSLFVHGGVCFKPYRQEFERLLPSSEMVYMETYNASEGFFALQDDPADTNMLLMLDYGTFYEFRDTTSHEVVPLEGVVIGRNYAMIVTTLGGLWRYEIGDTVEFCSLDPYKIRITGRTKHFINAFGEELIIDNAQQALHQACVVTGAAIAEYTAAPIFMEQGSKGRHEWLLEFSRPPSSIETFGEVLDKTLAGLNSDYAAKRSNGSTLEAPLLTVAPAGTFYRWMASRGKVGGQNKVPRLFNTRKYIDELKI